jgi:LysM repeat protein
MLAGTLVALVALGGAIYTQSSTPPTTLGPAAAVVNSAPSPAKVSTAGDATDALVAAVAPAADAESTPELPLAVGGDRTVVDADSVVAATDDQAAVAENVVAVADDAAGVADGLVAAEPAAMADGPGEAAEPLADLAAEIDAAAVIASAPADEPSADTAVPPPAPAAVAQATRPLVERITSYRVAAGDSLAAIARRFGIGEDTLRWANTLPADPDLLYVGQNLVVLPVDGVLDAAHAGDTLQSVAERYGKSAADLATANGLQESDTLSPGQRLLVPGGRPVVAAAPPAGWPPPPLDAGYRQDFIAAAVGPAQQSQRETGVPASVTIAQAIHESDWGISKLAREANNYFGIKATGKSAADVYWIATWEVVDGEDVMVQAPFQAYQSLDDSFADHGRFFLRNPRYAAARLVANDPRRFAQAIADAGYATDPAYAAKLIRLMDQYDLYQYDTPASESKAPSSAAAASPEGAFDCHCWVLPVQPPTKLLGQQSDNTP